MIYWKHLPKNLSLINYSAQGGHFITNKVQYERCYVLQLLASCVMVIYFEVRLYLFWGAVYKYKLSCW